MVESAHSDARLRARRTRVPGLAVVCLLAFSASPVQAADVQGSYSVFVNANESDGVESDRTDQQLTFQLFQNLTPYVNIRLGYQAVEFETETDLVSFERSSREPSVDLTYSRRKASGRLTYLRRTTEGSAPNDNFELESILGSLSWTPDRGPGYEASFRDESNVADVGVFGRGTDSRYLTLGTFYRRRLFSVDYSFQRAEVANRLSGFSSDQNRHELLGNGFRSFLDDAVSLDYSASISRVDRVSEVSDDVELADPVPARRGLSAVDPLPDVGELDPAPGLIDRDTNTAVGIDIGGANTFRNVGLDLGVASLVSRLEISVDSVSGADLVWEVYRSPDNLIWRQVVPVMSNYDPALLRYDLTIPQTTDRYFKAVNVSVNTEPAVQVTEMRAFLDIVQVAQRTELESTFYRADVGATFRPRPGISAGLDLGFRNDEDLSAGLVRRDFRAVTAGARVGIDLSERLRFDASYRYNDTENRRDPALLRTEHQYGANLRWSPLATVDAAVSIQHREESEEGTRLQSNQSARLVVSAALLPTLRLNSDFDVVQVDDPLSGLSRDGWSWRQSLSAGLMPRWLVGASYRVSDFEGASGDADLRRESYGVTSTWRATEVLNLQGSWSVGREDGRKSTRQSYNLSYNPGPKLSFTASYNEFATESSGGTASDSASLNYRAGRHMTLFGSLTRSETKRAGLTTGEVTSVRFGLRLFI